MSFAASFEERAFDYLRSNGLAAGGDDPTLVEEGTVVLRELLDDFARICAVDASGAIRGQVDVACFVATQAAERAEACAVEARDCANENGWDWRGDGAGGELSPLGGMHSSAPAALIDDSAAVVELTHERRTWQLVRALFEFFLECEEQGNGGGAAQSAERALWQRVRTWLELDAPARPARAAPGAARARPPSGCAADDLLSSATNASATPPGETDVLEDVWIMVRHGALEEAAAFLREVEGGRHAWRADSIRRTCVGGGANEWRWLESCKQLAQCAQKRGGRGGAFEQAIYAALCGDSELLADAQRRIAKSHRDIHASFFEWRRRAALAPIPPVAEAADSKLVALHALQRKWPYVVANYPAAAGGSAAGAAAPAATMRSAHDAMWACVQCHLARGEQRRELGSLLDALRETAWIDGSWSVASRQASVCSAVAHAGAALPGNDDAARGACAYLAMQPSDMDGWSVAPRPTRVQELLATPAGGAGGWSGASQLRGAARDQAFFLTLQKQLIEFVATWAERRDAAKRTSAAPFGAPRVNPTAALCAIIDSLAGNLASLSEGFRPGALRFAAHFALFHRLTEIRFRAAGVGADDVAEAGAGGGGEALPPHPLAVVPRHSMFRLIAEYTDSFGDEVLRGAGIGGAWVRRSLGARHVAIYAATLEDRVEGEAFSRHMVCVLGSIFLFSLSRVHPVHRGLPCQSGCTTRVVQSALPSCPRSRARTLPRRPPA